MKPNAKAAGKGAGKVAERAEGEADPSGEQTFDTRLERLETLVSEMESGDLSLESALAHYREGVGLLRQCHGILADFKRQVEELGRDSEQGLKPYRGDPDAEPDAGESGPR